jgi:hypothetical protein
MNLPRSTHSLCTLGIAVLMTASCGGGDAPGTTSAMSGTTPTQAYLVRGNVIGLGAGTSIRITNNGTDALVASDNGGFEFAHALASGAPYSVAISAQPQGKTCTVRDGIGAVGAANVTSILVSCATDPLASYQVRGTVSGLNAASQVQLQDRGVDEVVAQGNGTFAFPAARRDSTLYDVSVKVQPAGQSCTVANPLGVIVGSDVTSLSVTCANAYVRTHLIGGTVSGLATGASLVLLDNSANALAVSANGGFDFPASVAYGSAYDVTVGTQAAGESCSVANGVGTVGRGNVTNITVTCASAATYSIGGTVSGLSSGASVKLLDNNASPITVPANGTFVFAAQLRSGAAYSASVATQPTGESCAVTQGSGTVGTAAVTTIQVACSVIPSYTVGGTVSGLSSGASVGLLDNGSSIVTVASNGAFTFPAALDSGAAYAATVGTEPAGETCTLAGSTGNVASANITSIVVTCGVNPSNPAPSASSLAPASASVGAPALTLTVSGSNFVATSVVDWNGTALATTYASASRLAAVVPAADLAAAETASITVVNPAPGGGTSTVLPFSVAAASTGNAAVRQVQTLTGGQTHANGVLASPWSVTMTVLAGSALWVVGTVPIADDQCGISNYQYPNINVSDGTNTYTLVARANDPNLVSDGIEGTQAFVSWAALNVPAGTYTVSMLPGCGTSSIAEDWVAVAAVEITGVTAFEAAGESLQTQIHAGTNTVSATATSTSANSFLIAATFDDESSGTNPGTPAAGTGFTDQGSYWPLVTAGGNSLRIETLSVPTAGAQTAYFSPTEGADSQKRYPDYLTLTAIFH